MVQKKSNFAHKPKYGFWIQKQSVGERNKQTNKQTNKKHSKPRHTDGFTRIIGYGWMT